MKSLFLKLYKAQNETELQAAIDSNPIFQDPSNWYPLGADESNFATIENQQASAIGALIEKFTNSIDATLMKKCYELGIDPKSPDAPRTMQEAIEKFYGEKHQWLSRDFIKREASNIQVIADGITKFKSARTYDTSLTIYDNGEGQHPEDFENTFLSIRKGNKNNILFVQGKYNMGGTGSIVFCGKNRYQLIASRKHDGTGEFGFTLIRKRPFGKEEQQRMKNTWYEYLKIDGKVPSFPINTLDLGLHEKLFKTGSIIKLYSYDLPEGARSVISKDLKDRVDEYLFEPALPILMVDKKERYPKDRELQRVSFGLKRRLEKEESKYIEDYFTLEHNSSKVGDMKVTSYVFKTKVGDKNIKESRTTIRNEFFRSKMYVVFTMNGQVQGHLTSEFITRSLKFPLLKDHLLIHVDCTNMEYDFRSQLFMASRDRLKEGEEYRYLRDLLTKELKSSKLETMHKTRKDSISVDSADTNDLIRSFTKNLPLNNDLLKLLNNTFDIEQEEEKKKKKKEKKKKEETPTEEEKFEPQRFPSFFKYKNSKKGTNAISIQKGKSKTLEFETDVENHYFDRDEDQGELKISLVDVGNNETEGGTQKGTPKDISEVFDVSKTSPEDGKIKVTLQPTDKLDIGDEVQIKIDLTSPSGDFEETILIEIDQPQKDQSQKEKKEEPEKIGLPELALTAQNPTEDNIISWDKLGEFTDMDYDNIMYIYSPDGEKLEKIYINLDSTVLKNYKSKLNSSELREKAEKEYIAKVYFHTLFLYSINKNSKYRITKGDNQDELEINEYLQSIFEHQYTSFLINFNMNELIDNMEF